MCTVNYRSNVVSSYEEGERHFWVYDIYILRNRLGETKDVDRELIWGGGAMTKNFENAKGTSINMVEKNEGTRNIEESLVRCQIDFARAAATAGAKSASD